MPTVADHYQLIPANVRLMSSDAGARLNRRWMPSLLWAGVILVGTSLPGNAVPHEVSLHDKALHFSAYAVLGALLARDLQGVTATWWAALIAMAVAVAFGAADEWHQQFIPGRYSDVADWRADSIGAVGGTILWVLLHRNRRLSITTE